MQRRFFIMLCVAVMAIAVSQAPPQTAATRTIVKERVIQRPYRSDAAVRPDGYMTAEECRQLPFGETLSDLVYRFGWPAAQDTTEALASRLLFPLREDHKRDCVVEIWRGVVDVKVLDTPDGNTYRMESKT